MLVSLILTMMAAQTAPPRPLAGALVCGNQDAETAARRSSAGFTTIFRVHTDDDHDKNSHECEADYSIAITDPDGKDKPVDQFSSSIDEWFRPIVVQIDGFSQDGNRVYLLLREGGRHPAAEAIEYDMRSGRRINDVFLGQDSLQRGSRACVATLHIAGISQAGLMILESSAAEGCAAAGMWQLRPNARSRSGEVLPEVPERLLSSDGIVRLDPGKVVGH